MQKNWYVVYTKPQCEKKLASLFSKWKIENFYPLNCVKSSTAWRSKMVCEPLFKSYLFVYISEDQIPRLCRVEGVVNFLHWLGKPAIIKNEEIEVMREFTNDYQDISVQRGIVNMEGIVKIIDDPSYKMEGKFISIKSKTVKVNLPSLGFTLIAIPQKETILDKQNSLLENIISKISHTEVNTA
ncbi:MAG: transcription termination/antitermination NusG family protein [Ginsengibacter sp.]